MLAAGRKYSVHLLSFFILAGGFSVVVMSPTPLLVTLFENLIWGLFLLNSGYYGGNVANKWVSGKKPLTPETRNNTVNEGDQEDGNVRG